MPVARRAQFCARYRPVRSTKAANTSEFRPSKADRSTFWWSMRRARLLAPLAGTARALLGLNWSLHPVRAIRPQKYLARNENRYAGRTGPRRFLRWQLRSALLVDEAVRRWSTSQHTFLSTVCRPLERSQHFRHRSTWFRRSPASNRDLR